MKFSKLLFVLTLSIVALAGLNNPVNAQVLQKLDTMEGVTVANIDIPVSGSYASLSLDLLFTEVGGTSDGTVVLQGGNTLSTLTTLTTADFGNFISYSSNDTLTVTDGGQWLIDIKDPAFRYYRLVATGTTGDTTAVQLKYTLKER